MKLRRPLFTRKGFVLFVRTPSRKRTVTSFVLVAMVFLWIGMTLRNILPVAVVNGSGIARKDFTERVLLKAGPQVMDQLIVSKLLVAEAQKRHVVLSEKEIDEVLAKVEAELVKNNATVQDYLVAQGSTLSMLRIELRNQLIVEKLFGANIVVTQKEIDAYFTQNNIRKGTGAVLISQTIAIKKAVRTNKLREAFQIWLQKELQNAEILRLI